MKDGILDKEYINKRKKGTYFHRLKRRSYEVCNIIREYTEENKKLSLLDLGCAEGAFFDMSKIFLPEKTIDYTGIEYSLSCLSIRRGNNTLINADINRLPLKKEVKFDIIILTAVLEHILNPEELLYSLTSHLTKDGIIIITMPDPFFEKIASFLGNIEESGHHNPIDRKGINKIIKNTDLILDKYIKFMISPWGFIFEKRLEKIYPDILLLNQLFVLKTR